MIFCSAGNINQLSALTSEFSTELLPPYVQLPEEKDRTSATNSRNVHVGGLLTASRLRAISSGQRLLIGRLRQNEESLCPIAIWFESRVSRFVTFCR